VRELITRIWPLPPPEKRRSGPVPPTWFIPVYRIERDADYLLGKLLNIVLLAGVALVGTIILDAHLAIGLLVDAAEFQQNKLLLPVTFSRLIGPPAFMLSLLFYLRMRVGIDICRDDIPVGGRKPWMLTTSRRKWIERALIIVLISPLCIFVSHIVVIQITLHYEQQDSLAFLLLPQAFGVAAVATGAICLPFAALILEKAIRSFPSFQENLQRNHDHYAKNKTINQ
jgi:hypothetical protein